MKADLIIRGSAAHIESLEATAERLALANGLFSSEAIRARIALYRAQQGLPEHAAPRVVPPLGPSDTIKAARARLRALKRRAGRAIEMHGFFSSEAIRPRIQGYYLEERIAATLSRQGAA